MPVSLFACQHVFLFVCLPVCPTVLLNVFLPVGLPVCPFDCASVPLFACMSDSLSQCLCVSVPLFACLCVFLLIGLPVVFLSVCLSTCLYLCLFVPVAV